MFVLNKDIQRIHVKKTDEKLQQTMPRQREKSENERNTKRE
jgi:hypothetical protein